MHLIGSRYIQQLGIQFYRKFKDIDYLVADKAAIVPEHWTMAHDNLVFEQAVRVEYHVNPVLHDWIDRHGNSLEVMFTLKLSHVFWDVHWQKTVDDIKWYCRRGTKHIPELFELLYKHWTEKHGRRREPKFTRRNAEFFKDAVPRKVDHDELHEIVMFGDRPMFERIKEDLTMAEVSEKMFTELSHDDRVLVVAEELMVLTIERFPSNRILYNSRLTNFRTLTIMIQRLLPDWMALWTVLNFSEVHRAGDRVKEIAKNNPHILKDYERSEILSHH